MEKKRDQTIDSVLLVLRLPNHAIMSHQTHTSKHYFVWLHLVV